MDHKKPSCLQIILARTLSPKWTKEAFEHPLLSPSHCEKKDIEIMSVHPNCELSRLFICQDIFKYALYTYAKTYNIYRTTLGLDTILY